MENPPMVYKSNALVEAAYRLSVQEQRIILACIGQVRRDEQITDEVLYSVTAADLANLSGMAVSDAYKELKEAALRLKRREVRLTQEPNGKGKKPKVMITGWVQTIFYIEGEGRVELRFTKDMLPYLTDLQREFTRYALSDVAKMTSAHGIRLYELLAQWPDGHREVALNDLRRWLQLEDRYPSIKDFKLRVLDPAVAQINEHSPLAVTWEQRKTGRKVTHLTFTFGPKKPTKAAGKAPRKTTERRKGGKLSEAEMQALARPGETWEQLHARLNQTSAEVD
ncbi:replication initiation protein [Azotobacter beijerinckii]|uniref:Protein involved in initiation of plasmid replication n=2 Tax=Azotobacter beijerinckii TaxID=170623 RepID=A0A1I1CMM3_9GAMM|nr:replication initiation protein [Azotobacter beijerinckii]SFB63784.1 Protein involved in initiation of plasmid replication [Azotobacter beijerinckii]